MAEPTDPRLWGVLIVSIGSLVWNLLNTLYTRKLNLEQRNRTIRLEEFRYSVRDPLRTALDVCDDSAQRVKALAISAKALAEHEDEASQLNRDTIASLNELSDRLDEANHSEFSAGKTWLEGFSEFEDLILNAFDRGLNSVHSDDIRRIAFKKAETHLRDLKKDVTKRIESELIGFSDANVQSYFQAFIRLFQMKS